MRRSSFSVHSGDEVSRHNTAMTTTNRNSKDSYAFKWKDYRTRRLMFLASWIIIPLVAGIVDSYYLFVFAVCFFGVSIVRLQHWRCPRCHQCFSDNPFV